MLDHGFHGLRGCFYPCPSVVYLNPRTTRNTRNVFVYSARFAVIDPGAVARPGLTASRDGFDRRFLLSMLSTTPKTAALNRRLGLGLVPYSLKTLTSQGSAVCELWVRPKMKHAPFTNHKL